MTLKLIALVCPGQGSQKPGFLAPWLEIDKFRNSIEQMSEAIGLDLIKHGTVSDEETIRQTQIAQPLIVAASIASSQLFDLDQIDVVAGHSVGEVAAGYLAGILDQSTAIKLVDVRAKAMMEAALSAEKTGMAAVLGGEENQVVAHLHSLDLTPANYNGAGQIVAAGSSDKISELVANPPAGAKVIPLSVAGAFHTKFMQSAVEKLAAHTAGISFQDPNKTVLSNQNGQIVSSGKEYLELLVGQVANPVRWDICMKQMTSLGVTKVIELSPAGTLVGLAKRGMPEATTLALKSPEDLEKIKDFMQGGN